MPIIILYLLKLYATELDYLWNGNTAVLLYIQLSGHGERKLFAHMIDR